MILIGSGGEQQVGEWVATSGSRFEDGGAHFVPCSPGDIVKVFIDHGDSESHDVAEAKFAVGLIDHYAVNALTFGQSGIADEVLSGRFTNDSTDLTINFTSAQLPGDAMFLLLAAGGSGPGVGTFTDYPDGWTPLVDSESYGASKRTWSLLWRICDGTEPTSDTASFEAADEMVAGMWVVRSSRNYAVTPPILDSTVQSSGTATVDPPGVAANGNHLVFAIVIRNGGGRTPVSGPDGYELSSVLAVSPSVVGESINYPAFEVWRRAVAITTSENPGVVTYESFTGQHKAATTLAVPV